MEYCGTHLWDPLLRNPPKPPAGRPRLRRSWHTPYRVCAGGGPRGGGHRLFHQARRITACHSNNSSAGSPKQFRSSDDGMLYTAIETSAKGKSFSVCQMKIQLLWYTGYHRNEIVFWNHVFFFKLQVFQNTRKIKYWRPTLAHYLSGHPVHFILLKGPNFALLDIASILMTQFLNF